MSLRRSLIALVCALWAVAAEAQTFVQFKLDASGTPWVTDAVGEVTPDSGITAGNTVIVGFGVNASRTVTSVTDNGSNTYTQCETDTSGSGVLGWAYCGIAANAATVITVTLSSATGAVGQLFMWEFSGTHASDSIGGSSSGNDTTGLTHSSGTVTVEVASSVLVGFSYGTSGTYVTDVTYTSSVANTIMAAGYKAVSADDDMVNTTAGNEGTVTMAMEVLPAAAAAGCQSRMMLLGAGKC